MDRRLIFFALIISLGCSPKPKTTQPATETTSTPTTEPAADKYNDPFTKAVTDEAGPDQLPPVDRTVGGKSTAHLRDDVEKLWPTIKLIDADQKPLPWTVIFETDAGTLEIALRPDLAPNHVRNLIALVQAGYYEGLRFDRLVHQQAEAPDGGKFEIRLVELGCPAGTGDPGVGHIGYWLRSEFSDAKHEAGTVGFDRDEDPSSAGVRLYITLAPTPIRDGSYSIVGKVTKGLDVVEKISKGKLLAAEVDPTRELPERPTVIRKASASYK